MEVQVPAQGEGAQSRIVVLSDTHCMHDQVDVPPGDILIHCGDFTNKGKKEELMSFNEWLGTLPHPHKFLIIGNHEAIKHK